MAVTGLGADFGIAAAAFVGTNIDNCVVTMTMVAGAPLDRARRIAAGQVAGFVFLVVLAAAAAAVLFEFSPKVVGLLGLVPLTIGVRGLVGLRQRSGPEEGAPERAHGRGGAGGRRRSGRWADPSPRAPL